MANIGSTLYSDYVTKNQMFTETEKTYSVFTGADIVAYMGQKRVATLQGITVSITREVMPVFVMGDPNPKAFAKGKRAIAGNLVFTQFDKHAILKMSHLFGKTNPSYLGELGNFAQNNSLINAQSSVKEFYSLQQTNQTMAGLVNPNGDTNAQAIKRELAETYALVSQRRFKFADQVPPLDVTITMVNENGQVAYTAVHGVQLVNEGFGYTLDDLSSEVAFTFVARDVTPLDNVLTDSSGSNIIGSALDL
jgi:hypothetical protein